MRVSLVKIVYDLPDQSVCAQVRCTEKGTTQLVEQLDDFREDSSMKLELTLVQMDEEGLARVILSNPNAYSLKVDGGTRLGVTHPVTVVEPTSEMCSRTGDSSQSAAVSATLSERLRRLLEAVGKPELLDITQTEQLHF